MPLPPCYELELGIHSGRFCMGNVEEAVFLASCAKDIAN